MLALLLACLIMYIYTRSGAVSISVDKPNIYHPYGLFQIHSPIPNADVVAVELPNAMECYA